MLSEDGRTTFHACDHPEFGGFVRGTGTWKTIDSGKRLEVIIGDFEIAQGKYSITASNVAKGAITATFGKSNVEHTEEQLPGVRWNSRVRVQLIGH